ncbi:MAG: TenA family transcriptional regulator [Thermoanaerobaculia bacterium]
MTAVTELADSLLAAAQPAPIETHPFIERVLAGTLPKDIVREYALLIYSIASVFPRRIAAVLSICPQQDVRRALINNLLEEEGVTSFQPEVGASVVADRRHSSMAAKFARAAGATDADIAAQDPAPSRWFADAIASGDWLGAYAYFAVGHEANVPRTFRMLVPALIEHYGFTQDELEFLTEHYVADERHGREAAEMLASIAEEPAARERTLEGARRGGMAWWLMHRQLLRAHGC